MARSLRSLALKFDRTAQRLSILALGGATPRTDDASTYLKVYREESWVHSAINVVARSLAGVPLIAKDADGELIEDSPIIETILNPNEEMDGYLLRLSTVIYLLATGQAFWGIEREGQTVQLYPLQSDMMYVMRDKTGRLTGYQFKNAGIVKDFKVEEIVHFLLFDPYDRNQGLCPIKPLETPIDLLYYIKKDHKNFFKNGALPSFGLKVEGEASEEDLQKIMERFKMLYGDDNRYNIAAYANADLQPLRPPISEMQFVELNRAMREAILASMGPIPPFVLGILDHANYANSYEGKRIFWELCVQPLARLIEGSINSKLPQVFDVEDIISHDYSDIEALQEDKQKKAARLYQLHVGGIITANEARQELNLELVDTEEANQLRTPQAGLGNIPGETSTDTMKAPFTGGTAAAAVGIESALTDNKTAAPPHIVRAWSSFMQRRAAAENAVAPVIRRFFRGQKARVLEQLDKLSNGKSINLHHVVMEQKDVTPDSGDLLLDLQFENEMLETAMTPTMKRVIAREYAHQAAALGVDIAFDVTNPRVLDMIRAAKNRIVGINKTTYDALKALLKDAYLEGASIGEMKKRITEQFSDFTSTRAKTIAQNESGAFVNGGSYAAAKDSGVVKQKQWVSAMLPNYRPQHVALQDQGPIPIDQKFVISSENGTCDCDYPHDPSLPPGEAIWCHCTLTYVVGVD